MKYLNIKQVSENIGYAPRTIRQWCEIGKIKATKIGRKWLINQKIIENLIKGGETNDYRQRAY